MSDQPLMHMFRAVGGGGLCVGFYVCQCSALGVFYMGMLGSLSGW